jgi:hypothetical protein
LSLLPCHCEPLGEAIPWKKGRSSYAILPFGGLPHFGYAYVRNDTGTGASKQAIWKNLSNYKKIFNKCIKMLDK